MFLINKRELKKNWSTVLYLNIKRSHHLDEIGSSECIMFAKRYLNYINENENLLLVDDHNNFVVTIKEYLVGKETSSNRRINGLSSLFSLYFYLDILLVVIYTIIITTILKIIVGLK